MRTGTCEVTARAAGTPPGHGSFCAPSPAQSGWGLRGPGQAVVAPAVPLCPTVVTGDHGRVTQPGCPGLGDRAVPAPGCGSTGRGMSAQPGDRIGHLGDLSRVTPVSVQAAVRLEQPRGTAGPAMPLRIQGLLLPPGMFARWHGDSMGDREGCDRATPGYERVLPSPRTPNRAAGRGGRGAVPALLPRAAACRRG